MNIGIISLNCGGTAGHMTLTTKLSDALTKKGKKVFLVTDNDYSIYLKNKKLDFKIKKIKKGKHKKTTGGCLNYDHFESFVSIIKKNNISTLIFSTFYDLKMLNYCKKNNIKTILVSYPLRDSHREIIKARKYYKNFSTVITLKEIYKFKKVSPNEKIVSPLATKIKKKPTKNKELNILVTCGGGGRPSSESFFKKIEKIISLIIKKYPKTKFTIIKGNHKLKTKFKNSKIVSWSKKFPELLNSCDLIISEAGYYTLVDIISLGKKAILIPGERRVDNQELRAIKFEQSKLSITLFPSEEEGLEERIYPFIESLKEDKTKWKNFQKRLFSEQPIDKVLLNIIK